jgi:acetyl-CoA synthetase
MAHERAPTDRVLPRGTDYADIRRRFRWRIPAQYNIAVDVCDRHAVDRNRLAMIYEDEAGAVSEHSFREFSVRSSQLAHGLRGLGIERGSRIGIHLSQRPETAVAHLAAYKLGAIALPLSTLFGPDALEYRLADAGATGVVTDGNGLESILAARQRLPDLHHVISVDPVDADATFAYQELIAGQPETIEPAATSCEDPAIIIYTSGTTGPPKGALFPHRVVLGHLPSIEFDHDYFPRPDDRPWSPADWAWVGGLFDTLLTSWHYGIAVVACRARRFEPEQALDLMARHRVRNTVLVPTMLRLLRRADRDRHRYPVRLRTIITGGEPVGRDLIQWSQEAFGVVPSEVYGQTEINLIAGSCHSLMPFKPGSTGRAVPGHVVEIVDADGHPVPPGELGEFAVRRPDPIMFLEYWNNPAGTAEKFMGDWALTGDLGRKDEDGYLWFVGRSDDVIKSSGYRIGPSEIEESLMRHPAVLLAAAIGAPDPDRGEIVKAFIQLRDGTKGSVELARELALHVRERLSAHAYPREIEFLPELPTTTTGKVRRAELRRLQRERRESASPVPPEEAG